MKKPLLHKVTIIGVGLIGGSIGLAIKKRKLARWVVGVVRRKQTAISAVSVGAADVVTLNLAEGIKGADLVILCAPVSTIIKQMPLIRSHLKKGAIVIDAGSSKIKIEGAAAKHLRGSVFVGCHPMAGSASTGVEHADADLFAGAQCFITRSNKLVTNFWKALGAKPLVLNAKLHDAWVARASYLPHLLAFSLFQKAGLGKFSGKGLKALNPSAQELARLAASNAALWADILVSNPETLPALLDFEKNIEQLKKMIRSKKVNDLKKFILSSNHISSLISPHA